MGSRRKLGYESPAPFPSFAERQPTQFCAGCKCKTGKADDDSLYDDEDRGPLCQSCYEAAMGIDDPDETEELNFDRD